MRASRFHRGHARRRGGALIFALIGVFAVAALSAAFLQMTSSLGARQAHLVDNRLAFYLAEAGLDEAYYGLTVGKSGQIGSETDPVLFGDGLYWVDSEVLDDGTISLTSSALCGRGAVVLAVLVTWDAESVASLGFYTREPLRIEAGCLIDGYDSTLGTYAEQVDDTFDVPHASAGARLGSDGEVLLVGGAESGTDVFVQAEPELLLLDPNALPVIEFESDPGPVDEPVSEQVEPAPNDGGKAKGKAKGSGAQVGGQAANGKGKSSGAQLDVVSETTLDEPAAGDQLKNNDKFAVAKTSDEYIEEGLARQNGSGKADESSKQKKLIAGELTSVSSSNTGAFPGAHVFGDATHGLDQRVAVEVGAVFEGNVLESDEPEPLPLVDTPTRELAGALDVKKMQTIPATDAGYQRIDIGKHGRLVIQGPGTLVVERLEIAGGGELVFDTTDGPVDIFVLQSFLVGDGASVTTLDASPRDVSVQVSAVDLEDPSVVIGSDATFYGSLFAPRGLVDVHEGAEVFGSIVSKKLLLATGVQLHYDNALVALSEDSAMPRMLAWEIIEMSAPGYGSVRDPFADLGVDPNSLRSPSDGHGTLWVEVRYVDHSGAQLDFEGWEVDFDWAQVATLLMHKSYDDDPLLGGQKVNMVKLGGGAQFETSCD